MLLLSRKQFVERFLCTLGAALVSSVFLDQTEDSSKEVVLVREITDNSSPTFDHSAYHQNRKNFLDEKKFNNLTHQMIANKEILDLKLQYNPSHMRIEIKFNSKKSYSKYRELTLSFARVDIFETTNYVIKDKIIHV
jgi:hypothetical protein